jgi:tungstate transport system permease protein
LDSTSFFSEFFQLLDWHSDLWEIIALSLQVSSSATIIAVGLGLPLAILLATKKFVGHRAVLIGTNTLLGLPPVLVGLLVYLALSRSGPFAVFDLLYTPTAMIIAQVILITPIITSLSHNHLHKEWQRIGDQLRSLKITGFSAKWTLLSESRYELGTVLLAGFGRAIAEIGPVVIAGGNIEHYTRVMTTAVALETSKGNLEKALALGIVLLIISLGINLLVALINRGAKEGHI